MEKSDLLFCDVLLFEDDPLVVTLLDTVISKRAGLAVRAFPSLEEGLPLLRSAASGQRGRLPRIIIVDWNLRQRTAKEFITWVRMSATMGHLPVYAVSAHDDKMLAQMALDAGATEFCSKNKLLGRLEAWTAGLAESATG